MHKKKVWHHQNRRSKKKLRKQQNLLTEVIVPTAIKQNLVSESDIENEIVVVDGGDDGNPSICSPGGLKLDANTAELLQIDNVGLAIRR